MAFMDSLPVWGLAILIFCLRIVDVTIGTVRTIAVVQGRTVVSVCLGFVEVLIWVTVVSQVIQNAADNPFLLLAFAAGFAAGNATGIALERQLALGSVILRIVSISAGDQLADFLRDRAARVYTFDGRDDDGSVLLIYVVVLRREARNLVKQCQKIDPDLFFAVDSLRETNAFLTGPIPRATGWRSVVKMK